MKGSPLSLASLTPLSAIHVGERTRRELGDLPALAKSIDQHGLLHPIVVTESGELIAGARRLEAYRLLGRDKIPASVLHLEHIVLGEQAENIDRKDFTVEERVEIGERIEALLTGRRGSNQHQTKLPENFPEAKGRETRSIAAEKAGFSNAKTYDQAKAVRAAAREDPESSPSPLPT